MSIEKFSIKNFDPNSNYAIKASAGTGKTYSIIQIVDKLVNRYKMPLSKILIVTYTEKACGELKDRIAEKLGANAVKDANVFTIHSFCQSVLEEFGDLTSLPLKLELVNENEIDNFIDSFVREKEFIDEFNKFSKYHTLTIDGLKDVYEDLCRKFYTDKKGNISKILTLFNYKIIKEFVNNFNNSLPSPIEFQKCKENYIYNSDFSKFFRADNFPLYKRERDYDDKFMFNKKYSCLLFKIYFVVQFYEKLIYSITFNKLNYKKQDFNNMLSFVEEEIIFNKKFREKILEKYSYAIIDEFQDTNQLQYNIFENLFMQDNAHHLLVVGDEKQSIYSFQGADLNVFNNAIDEIEGKKQNLKKNYRSSKEMIESANNLFKNIFEDFENSESIDINKDINCTKREYRYNGETTKGYWLIKDGNEVITSQKYAEYICWQIADFCTYIDNKTKLQLIYTKNNNGKIEPELSKNVSFKDFCILCRTKSEMSVFENQLKLMGIPFVKYKDVSLFKYKPCADWIALFDAIATKDFSNLYDRKKYLKALYTKFFGYRLDEINKKEFNKDNHPSMELIFKWKSLLSENRYEEFIDSIIYESSLIKNLNGLTNIEELNKYKQIGEYCVDYLYKNNSLTKLIEKLNLLNTSRDEDEDNENGTLTRKSTNLDCVQLMTIHASKGLQFPVVFFAAGEKGKNKKVSTSKFYDKTEKQNYLLIGTGGSRSTDIDTQLIAEMDRLFYVALTRAEFLTVIPKYKQYYSEETELYKKLNDCDVLNIFEAKDVNDIKINNKEIKEAVKEICNKNYKLDDSLIEFTSENQKEEIKKLKKSLYFKSTYKKSYTNLTHNKLDKEIIEEGEAVDKERYNDADLSDYDISGISIPLNYDSNIEPLESSITLTKGDKFGSAIHEVLEEIDFKDHKNNLEEIIKERLKRNSVYFDNETIEKCKILIENVLNAKLKTLNNKEFSLKEISKNERKSEIEFNYNINDNKLLDYFNGIIDLIFLKDGRYCILDWKSDSLNDQFTSYSNSDQLKKQVDKHYSIQRVLYSYSLIKWIKLMHPSLDEEEIFNKYYGGIYYVFLRGCVSNYSNGIYLHSWSNFNDLKQEYNKIINKKED